MNECRRVARTDCAPQGSPKFRVQRELRELGQEGGRRADRCARDSQATSRRCRRRPVWHARGSAPWRPRSSTTPPPLQGAAHRRARPEAHVLSVTRSPAAPPARTHPRSPAYPARAPLPHPQREVTFPRRGRRGDRGCLSVFPPGRPASPRLPHTSCSEPADPGAWAPPTFTPRSCWAGRGGTNAHARSRGGASRARCAGVVVFPTWVDLMVPCNPEPGWCPHRTGVSDPLVRSPPRPHTPPQALARLFPSDSASDPASSFYTPTVIYIGVCVSLHFLLVESFQTFGLLSIQLLQKFYLIYSFNLYLF